MDFVFLRLKPSSDLAAYVDNFWFMRGPGPAAMPEGHRILPDGSMEFVFQLGEAFFERRPDGRWRKQAHLLFVGQMERRVDIKPSGVIHTAGIHFHPAGASAFVAGDLGRFVNRIVPLASALGEDPGPVAVRLRAARSPERRVALLEDFLRTRRRPHDEAMADASRRLLEATDAVDIEAMASAFGLSDRQFRRRFEAAVGLGPKRFARIVRFQRVFEQRLEHDARAWSEVALDCGYYDQAHFNRDFRAFAGVRPRDIIQDADPLTAFFLSVSSKTREGPAR